MQVADANGTVSYTSIFPACYSGRWPHIHFEVYPTVNDITDATNAIATSQVVIPQADCEKVYVLDGYTGSSGDLAQVSFSSDNVFGDDSGASQLATVTRDARRDQWISIGPDGASGHQHGPNRGQRTLARWWARRRTPPTSGPGGTPAGP